MDVRLAYRSPDAARFAPRSGEVVACTFHAQLYLCRLGRLYFCRLNRSKWATFFPLVQVDAGPSARDVALAPFETEEVVLVLPDEDTRTLILVARIEIEPSHDGKVAIDMLNKTGGVEVVAREQVVALT